MIKVRELFKKPYSVAAISAMISGIIVHMFGLVNVLNNHDSLFNIPTGYGTGVESGRWMLSVLGDISQKIFGNYSSVYLKGILYIILIALSAGFIVSTLNIERPLSCAFAGMAVAVFPTVTSTMFYRFTSDFYGLACLFAVIAAWALVKYKYGFILSAVLIACSLGIYQAYLPLTVTILVLYLIRLSLAQEKWQKILIKGLYFCGVIIVGLILYFLFMKISLLAYGVTLNDYKGISGMGKIKLSDIPYLVGLAYKNFLKLPIKDYCQLAQKPLIRLCYIALGMISVFLIGYILIVKKKKTLPLIMTAVLCLLFPLATNLIVVMCPGTDIYTLMVFSFVLIQFVPLVILEEMPEDIQFSAVIKKYSFRIVYVIIAVMVLFNSYIANMNYTALYYSNRQSENYMTSLVTQVRMTKGFDTEKKWAIVGEIQDPLLEGNWTHESLYMGNFDVKEMLIQYSWASWITNYVGYKVPWASEDEIEKIKKTKEYKEMKYWPDDGSVRIINDAVVVKMAESNK